MTLQFLCICLAGHTLRTDNGEAAETFAEEHRSHKSGAGRPAGVVKGKQRQPDSNDSDDD